jgi:hypothetical protein
LPEAEFPEVALLHPNWMTRMLWQGAMMILSASDRALAGVGVGLTAALYAGR